MYILVFLCMLVVYKVIKTSKLAQAEKRKEIQSQKVESKDESSINSSTNVTDEGFSFPPPKRSRSAGIVHDKPKCTDQTKSTQSVCLPNYTLLLHSECGHPLNAIPF